MPEQKVTDMTELAISEHTGDERFYNGETADGGLDDWFTIRAYAAKAPSVSLGTTSTTSPVESQENGHFEHTVAQNLDGPSDGEILLPLNSTFSVRQAQDLGTDVFSGNSWEGSVYDNTMRKKGSVAYLKRIGSSSSIVYGDFRNDITTLPGGTTTYTVTTNDLFSTIRPTAVSGCTLTIAAQSAQIWNDGDWFEVNDFAVGQITVQGDTGVSLNAVSAGLVKIKQTGCARFQRVGSDSWIVKSGHDVAQYTTVSSLPSASLMGIGATYHVTDGAAGAGGFGDSSSYNHAPSVVGDATTSTAVKKFGLSSGLFNGTSSYVYYPDHADFTFGAGQFTVEAWVYFNSTGDTSFVSKWFGTSASISEFNLHFTSGVLTFDFVSSGPTTHTVSSAWSPSTSTWYHIAVDRDASSDVRLYIDGTMVNKANLSATVQNTSQDVHLGALNGFGYSKFLDGYLDEVRISNTARWGNDGGFTPAAAAYSSDANTRLLVHMDAQAFWDVVQGGGAYTIRVTSDGTNWRVG